MKCRVTESAARDMAAIWEYTNREWGLTQADRYVDSLIARVEWLLINKSLWSARDDVAAGVFSYPHERHVVLFRQVDQTIEIIRVLRASMDVAEHLR